MTPTGLPHSGIHGSKPAYDSPWHFAVNRALLRLLAPRHPPYALRSLTLPLRHVSRLRTGFDLREDLGPARGAHARLLWAILLDTNRFASGFRRTKVYVLSSFGIRLSMNWACLTAGVRQGVTPCGAERDRTDDLKLAKPALSQLSYSPAL